MTTTIDQQIQILGDLWLNHIEDEFFFDFFESHEPALATAYAVSIGLATVQPVGERYITVAFNALLRLLDIKDAGYHTLGDVMSATSLQLT